MLEVEVISWVTLNSQTLNNLRLPLALYSNKGIVLVINWNVYKVWQIQAAHTHSLSSSPDASFWQGSKETMEHTDSTTVRGRSFDVLRRMLSSAMTS